MKAVFEGFYGFTHTPFARDIPIENLYRGQDTEELIGRLHYTAQRQLFAVVIGECGTGKSTILRRFVYELTSTHYRPLYIAESKLTSRLLYQYIMEQLGCNVKYRCAEAKKLLHKEIAVAKAVDGTIPVTIVDEAHLLPKETLEEIRFLLNFKMDSESPISLILCGQSGLWDRLKTNMFTAIRQRIDIHCIVGQLDRAQTGSYIMAHMEYSGANKEMFTDAAVESIYKFSEGIPRNINKICTQVLLYGAQNRKQLIDDHMVKLVAEQERYTGVK